MTPEDEKKRDELVVIYKDHYQKLFSKFYNQSAYNPMPEMQVAAEAFGIHLPEIAIKELDELVTKLKEKQ